jgi:hypothetical protein
MIIAVRRYGAGQSNAATVAGKAIAPVTDAIETILVKSNATIKTPATTAIASGASANHTPSEVATPRPPPSRKKTEAIEPTKAANATIASAAGTDPITNLVNSTGAKPFSTSPARVIMPGILPPARATLVVPTLCDPIVRGSNPQARPTNTPTGIEPNRYPVTVNRASFSVPAPISVDLDGRGDWI